LAFYGGTRGAWHGLLLGSLFAGILSPDHHFGAWNASMLLGSVAGTVGGYGLAAGDRLTPGQARTIAAVGDFGLLSGFGAGFLLKLDRKDSGDAEARGMAAAGLLGTTAGLAGGY